MEDGKDEQAKSQGQSQDMDTTLHLKHIYELSFWGWFFGPHNFNLKELKSRSIQ